MKALLSKFRRDEDGAALVEYGIALLVVILVGTGALLTLSNDTSTLFQSSANATTTSVGLIPADDCVGPSCGE